MAGADGEKLPGIIGIQHIDVTGGLTVRGGKQRQLQALLVVILNHQTFEGVGDGLPPLVVLVEHLPVFQVTVLVNHQNSFAEKGDPPALGLLAFHKAGNGVAEVGRGLEATVRKQSVQGDMQPAELVGFNAARNLGDRPGGRTGALVDGRLGLFLRHPAGQKNGAFQTGQQIGELPPLLGGGQQLALRIGFAKQLRRLAISFFVGMRKPPFSNKCIVFV